MKHKQVLYILVICFLFCIHNFASADPETVFKKLEGLAGNWKGTFQWTGARTDGGAVQASYFLTGNGTALVENLSYGKDPVMTSVYHMDSGTLRMTHYCGAGNQPRLKAISFENQEQVIQFDMVDITNLADPDAPHVHAVKMILESENKITVTFGVTGHGKESTEEIHLERVAG